VAGRELCHPAKDHGVHGKTLGSAGGRAEQKSTDRGKQPSLRAKLTSEAAATMEGVNNLIVGTTTANIHYIFGTAESAEKTRSSNGGDLLI